MKRHYEEENSLEFFSWIPLELIKFTFDFINLEYIGVLKLVSKLFLKMVYIKLDDMKINNLLFFSTNDDDDNEEENETIPIFTHVPKSLSFFIQMNHRNLFLWYIDTYKIFSPGAAIKYDFMMIKNLYKCICYYKKQEFLYSFIIHNCKIIDNYSFSSIIREKDEDILTNIDNCSVTKTYFGPIYNYIVKKCIQYEWWFIFEKIASYTTMDKVCYALAKKPLYVNKLLEYLKKKNYSSEPTLKKIFHLRLYQLGCRFHNETLISYLYHQEKSINENAYEKFLSLQKVFHLKQMIIKDDPHIFNYLNEEETVGGEERIDCIITKYRLIMENFRCIIFNNGNIFKCILDNLFLIFKNEKFIFRFIYYLTRFDRCDEINKILSYIEINEPNLRNSFRTVFDDVLFMAIKYKARKTIIFYINMIKNDTLIHNGLLDKKNENTLINLFNKLITQGLFEEFKVFNNLFSSFNIFKYPCFLRAFFYSMLIMGKKEILEWINDRIDLSSSEVVKAITLDETIIIHQSCHSETTLKFLYFNLKLDFSWKVFREILIFGFNDVLIWFLRYFSDKSNTYIKYMLSNFGEDVYLQQMNIKTFRIIIFYAWKNGLMKKTYLKAMLDQNKKNNKFRPLLNWLELETFKLTD